MSLQLDKIYSRVSYLVYTYWEMHTNKDDLIQESVIRVWELHKTKGLLPGKRLVMLAIRSSFNAQKFYAANEICHSEVPEQVYCPRLSPEEQADFRKLAPLASNLQVLIASCVGKERVARCVCGTDFVVSDRAKTAKYCSKKCADDVRRAQNNKRRLEVRALA